MTKLNDCLYDWVFHYNIYTGLWAAFKREDVTSYFSDSDNPELVVHKSTDIKLLIDILIKLHSIKSTDA